MRTLLVMLVVGLGFQSAIATESDDIRLAERMIEEIKIAEKADKKAFHRAVKAVIGTPEGKERLRNCAEKDHFYWQTCVTGKWDYQGSYKALYQKFYKEELKKLQGP